MPLKTVRVRLSSAISDKECAKHADHDRRGGHDACDQKQLGTLCTENAEHNGGNDQCNGKQSDCHLAKERTRHANHDAEECGRGCGAQHHAPMTLSDSPE